MASNRSLEDEDKMKNHAHLVILALSIASVATAPMAKADPSPSSPADVTTEVVDNDTLDATFHSSSPNVYKAESVKQRNKSKPVRTVASCGAQWVLGSSSLGKSRRLVEDYWSIMNAVQGSSSSSYLNHDCARLLAEITPADTHLPRPHQQLVNFQDFTQTVKTKVHSTGMYIQPDGRHDPGRDAIIATNQTTKQLTINIATFQIPVTLTATNWSADLGDGGPTLTTNTAPKPYPEGLTGSMHRPFTHNGTFTVTYTTQWTVQYTDPITGETQTLPTPLTTTEKSSPQTVKPRHYNNTDQTEEQNGH